MIDNVLSVRRAIGSYTQRPAIRRSLLFLGALIFIVMAAVSIFTLPDRPNELSWPTLGVVLVALAPGTVLLSALEYHRTAMLTGMRIDRSDALQVAIASSAANLLPLPGSFLVRAGALRNAGVSNTASIVAPVGVGLTWIASGALMAGAWLTLVSASSFSIIMLSIGVVIAGFSIRALRSVGPAASWSTVAWLWGIETAMTLVSSLRYLLVLVALGFEGSIGQGLALALSSILATAIGIMPAGLGLREAIAGVLAPLVSLPAAVGVLAAVINRIIGLLALGAMAAVAFLAANRIEHPVDA